MSKRNKSLIALLLILTIGVVGLTVAYFSSTTTFENEFQTPEYGTTYTESFVSPDNWLPGDTTNKTVIVTNSGTVDEAVRISLSETWIPNNSNATLNGWIHADGTKSNHATENELSTDVRAAVINFTNSSDWTKVGDYYYYNYKLAPGQTTDSLIEGVTFNALTKLGDTCTPSTNNGTTTITCNSSGSDYDYATYKLTVNIETVQYNKYKEAWSTNVAIAESKPQAVNFAQHIMSKSNAATVTDYTDGVTTETYIFNHEVTEQTPALTDYRYIGNIPNNYVKFNCDNNGSNCEIWRAIGVFFVDDGEGNWAWRVKLVRGNAFAIGMAWDSDTVNDWNNASLKDFLNGDYYNRINDSNDYGLKESARRQIDTAVFYLGGLKFDTTYWWGTSEQLYFQERGTDYFNPYNSAYCNNTPSESGSCKIRKKDWIGYVGLVYPSDMYMEYAYGIDDICYNNPDFCYLKKGAEPAKGWLFSSNIREGENSVSWTWFLTAIHDNARSIFAMGTGGDFYTGDGLASYGASGSGTTRPAVYLSSDVQVIGGDGSEGDPYKLQ